MPAPLLGEPLSRRFTLHLTPGLMKLIDDVARRDCTTPSAWARAVLLAALKKEGVKLQVPLVSPALARAGMSKQQTNNKQQTVAESEATLKRFEVERTNILDRQALLADKRREIAFDALSGDKSASKLLDGLVREAAELQIRSVSINDAVAEAQRRLAAAREQEQKEANKQRALQVRQVLGELVEGLGDCGKALDLFVVGANKAEAALDALHRLGTRTPTRDVVRVYGALAIHTALMQSALWSREIGRHLAPNERKDFRQLKVQWHDMVERNAVAPYLDDDDGEQINNEQINSEQAKTEAA